MTNKTHQVRETGRNAVIACVHRTDCTRHHFCNRAVNSGFERNVCRHEVDHALREIASAAAVKKRPDVLSRATRRFGDGLARQRPGDIGLVMTAKGAEKSPCRIPGLQNVHWSLL